MKPHAWSAHEELDPASRELLAKRAARLRVASERATEEQTVPLAIFAVGEEQFAIEMGSLCAVLPLRGVTPVPLAPPQVLGIVRHQGEVVPVLSFASLVACRWRRDPDVLLVVETGAQKVGFDLEQVPREAEVPARVIAEARARSGGGHLELQLEGRHVALLDLSAVLASLEVGDAR